MHSPLLFLIIYQKIVDFNKAIFKLDKCGLFGRNSISIKNKKPK
jgi:hypothetical protein